MRALVKNHTQNYYRVVARGCYCGALCTCYKVPSVKSAYGALKAASWSSADVGYPN